MSSSAAAVRIRRMSAADLERVLEIAESLQQAPHWPVAAYAAAINPENRPRRIALVAECDSSGDQNLCEGIERQTAGAKAHTRLAGPDAGTKVPAYQSSAYQSSAYRVAGFALASIVAREAELETIAVAADGQRRGAGGFLLRALVDELRTAQASELILEVRASNRTALGFYKAQGFEETGRRLRYYADPEEDAVLMRLKLA